MKRTLFFFIVIVILSPTFAQIPAGTWRDHLPYNNCKKVVKIKDVIYCATAKNIFTYNITDQSINKLSRINGLSDMEISTMEYNSSKNILLIAYDDGNIDLLQNNIVTNISDIFGTTMSGSKIAHNIFFRKNYAYISYDFGIIVLDLDKNEIKDTYKLGESGITYPIYALTADDTCFYAATEKGIFKAKVTDQLLVNYTHWSRFDNLPSPNSKYNKLCIFNGMIIANLAGQSYYNDITYCLKNDNWTRVGLNNFLLVNEFDVCQNSLIVSASDRIYYLDENLQVVTLILNYEFKDGNINAFSSILDESGNLWVADQNLGLVFKRDTSNFKYVYPNGPLSSDVRNMIYNNGKIYASKGGTSASWGNEYNKGMLNIFADQKWTSIKNDSALDYTSIAIDPTDITQFYVGSWNDGIFKYKDSTKVDQYNFNNSALQSAIPGDQYVRIGGLSFDSNNNLWISNSSVGSPLVVKQNDGKWKSFQVGTYLNAPNTGDILIDNSNQIWMILPRGVGLFVYNPKDDINDESDDTYLKFNPKNIFSDIISNIYCETKDLDGAIWIGTDKGPVVYSNPENVLNGETIGYQPRILRNDGTDIVDALLGEETINCIAVDGANRKWIGTNSGGLFLVSSDGTKQILNFNILNSPLFSNKIISIAIDNVSGEVFIGTDKGIISYRSNATLGGEDFDQVYVYPNPIREDYHGDITIAGLVQNTIVKITDISGNLVFETKSLGGQAIWNGLNKSGHKVSTGVYLVFCSNEDGSKSSVTKMLVIH